MGTNHIQLPWSHAWASNTSNGHSHTPRQSHARGHQPHPTTTAAHGGSQPQPTATDTHVGTNHIQLLPQHTWAPYHTQLAVTHTGTNHIQLPPPHTGSSNHSQLPPTHTWELTTSNYYRNTRGHPIARNCHTRQHQPYPTGTTKFVGTNHIQLP